MYTLSMGNLETIPEEDLTWDSYYRIYYDNDDEFVPPENQNTIYTSPMAEGGFDITDTNEKTPLLPRDDDDDDAGIDWNTTDISQVPAPKDYRPSGDIDSTNPFEPGTASTPSGGKKIPMATRTRLPQEQGPRFEETSFGGEPTERLAWAEVKQEFENADERKLKLRYRTKPRAGGGGGGAIIEVSMREKDKWYPLYTKRPGDVDKSFNESLPKEIKSALGKSLDEQFNDTNAALQAKQKELAATQKQLEQAEQRAEEAEKLKRQMNALTNEINNRNARIRELEDEHGPLNEDAIQKLKNDKRKLENDKRSKQQELSQLQKNAAQADKIHTKVDKEMREARKLEGRVNELKAKQDALKPLDELKKKAEELTNAIAEDTRTKEDENTSPSERSAAEVRVAANEAELARVNTEIEVRERQRPLLERVKDIFKKHGWTLQAVALAVSIVFSALALAGLNGLKAGTKAVGKGLQAIGKKLGSLLPGLIGSIVSFIFKAAGQVFSFLAEHAWLLILAVVAFFMERLLKKRRT